jgi:hypothetical protein
MARRRHKHFDKFSRNRNQFPAPYPLPPRPMSGTPPPSLPLPPPCLHALPDPPTPWASRRHRGDPACFPPSPARYGVCLPRRGAQWTTTYTKGTPNGFKWTLYDLMTRRDQCPRDHSTSMLWRQCLKNIDYAA